MEITGSNGPAPRHILRNWTVAQRVDALILMNQLLTLSKQSDMLGENLWQGGAALRAKL